MSYAQENGYTPLTFNQIMNQLRLKLNTDFEEDYTEESFVGTAWYKFLYGQAQIMQQNEIKTSEIFAKLSVYIDQTNKKIQRPSVSYPGLIEAFESLGYQVSLKKIIEADAGKIHICLNVDETADDYPEKKTEIGHLINLFVAGGIVSMGDQVESITLSNGQTFDFKFFLPTEIPIILRATIEVSENNLLTVPTDEEIRKMIFANINARYRLGWDFEPMRYLNFCDAPYASVPLLEYSLDNGATWTSDVRPGGFQDLLTFGLDDIAVIINT